jgi:hypothetical protein
VTEFFRSSLQLPARNSNEPVLASVRTQ